MEEEEGSAVSDDCVLVQRQALRWCRMYNSQGKGEGWRKRRGVLSVMTVYWYRDRRSGGAECITHREREKDGGRGGECCQ